MIEVVQCIGDGCFHQPVVSKPDGLTYDFIEFAQTAGKQTSPFNAVASPAGADLFVPCAIGEFNFVGDVSAILFCGLRRADESETADVVS